MTTKTPAKIKRDSEPRRKPKCNLDFVFSDDVKEWYSTPRQVQRERLNEIRKIGE